MAKPPGVVALLTDFGLRDHYVGVMKGVILSVNPDARIIDISHEIPSQEILEGYFLLSNTYRYFPRGTVFVVVVDPGVGTDRAIVALETDRHTFLAPDNGLLGFLQKESKIRRAVRVTQSRYFLKPVSNTFHGRDIFAPVAGHLSRGLDLAKLGPKAGRLEQISTPAPRVPQQGLILGQVVSIDRFGNLVTNIASRELNAAGAGKVEVRIGKRRIKGLSHAYAEGKKGALIALVGSSGTVEVSVNKGNASELTGARTGDSVRLRHSTS